MQQLAQQGVLGKPATISNISEQAKPEHPPEGGVGEGFSTKDIQLGACHHFLKQVC